MKTRFGSGKTNFPKLENVVNRERLFSHLDSSQDKLLTWISGPPGAGKTTLISSYITARKKLYLWVRCDKTDNDIGSFISYLSFAAEQAQRGLGKSLPTFTPEYAGDVEPFIRNYIRKLLEGLKREAVIVLDDFHEIDHEGKLAQSLPAMAEEFNSKHSFIIISRKPTIETLARIQLNQQLLNIDWEQLQLTEHETKDIVKLQGSKQDQSRVKLLHKLCKGWIAALKLLLLSNNKVEPEAPSTEDQLDQTLFFNYLAQETFNHLSQDQKQALMQLALSPSMSNAHINMVANDDYNAAQIEQLLNQQLVQKFTTPVAHFKFHPLFKEFLKQQAEISLTKDDQYQVMLASASILAEQGLVYEAAELYMQLKQYEKLANIVLEHADAMCKQGRYAELESWLSAMPDNFLTQQPWLLFWKGASLLTTRPSEAKQLHLNAHELFLQNDDVKGVYLSWCSALEASMYTMVEFKFLKNWLIKLDELREQYPKYPSIEVRMRVLGARLFSYFIGYPQSADINSMMDTCYRLVRFVPVPALRVMVGTGLAWAYCVKGDGVKFTKVVDILRRNIDSTSTAPFHRIAAYIPIAYHDWSNLLHSNFDYAQRGLALAEKTGIHHLDGVLLDHKIISYLIKGDLESASNQITTVLDTNYRTHGVSYSAILITAVIIEVEQGKLLQALETSEECLEVIVENGLQMPQAALLNMRAEIFSALGKFDQALECIDRARVIADGIESNMLRYQGMISSAMLAYYKDDTTNLVNIVSNAFKLGRENHIYAYKGVLRSSILKLCMVAYEYQIEIDYVNRLIEQYQLSFPVEHHIIEQWPWKLKVRVFNQFNTQLENENVAVRTRSQGKTLELLQVLAVMGGRNVESWRITEVLWPDSDGDAAQQSLDTTTHRLRKLIGKEAVIVQNNTLSLSGEHCWTDVWQFEAIVSQLNELLNGEAEATEIYNKAKQLFQIYTGALLQDVNAAWLLPYREKYSSEFSRCMDQVLDYLNALSSYEQIIELSKQATLREPGRECFYLHTMMSYRELGQNSKALDVFRSCEQHFKHSQQSSLSIQIIQLADSIR